MMQSQYSAVEADGLGQWGAIAAAAMSAASSVYAAQQQKAGIAAQVKAQKEIAKMAQEVELEKVKLMKRQAEMANAPAMFSSPGGGVSTGAIIGVVGGGIALIALVAILARRKRK